MVAIISIMGRKKLGRVNLSVSIDPALLAWVDEQIEKRTYATRTHAFELGIAKLKLIEDIRLGKATPRAGYVVIDGK